MAATNATQKKKRMKAQVRMNGAKDAFIQIL